MVGHFLEIVAQLIFPSLPNDINMNIGDTFDQVSNIMRAKLNLARASAALETQLTLSPDYHTTKNFTDL